MGYAWEKFHGAVHALVGTGTIQQRLIYAAISLITLNAKEDLPPELQQDFEKLWKDLTKVHELKLDKGAIQRTIETLNDEDAKKYAISIFEIYSALARALPRR